MKKTRKRPLESVKIKILKIRLRSDLSWPKVGLEPKFHEPGTFRKTRKNTQTHRQTRFVFLSIDLLSILCAKNTKNKLYPKANRCKYRIICIRYGMNIELGDYIQLQPTLHFLIMSIRGCKIVFVLSRIVSVLLR